ncbi:MAG: hypothetical protein ACYSUI_21470 [Planctomycetota bacterium]|jgi:hypothetical protein
MSDLWDINPHLALLQEENYVSPDEKRTEAIIDEVAARLGLKNLDGDTDVDGYSIDQAVDMITAGSDADDLVAEFEHQMDEIANPQPEGNYWHPASV